MKVAVLWTALSGYLNSCMRELAQREGVELFVCHRVPRKEAPYDADQFNWIENRLSWTEQPDVETLEQRLAAFRPDVMIIAAWHIQGYRFISRKFVGRCLRIVAFDNAWRSTPKQWIGVLTSPFYLRRLADALWVPGERQAVFARKMGFPQSAILRGSLSCNRPVFAAVYQKRISAQQYVPRAFLYLGRLAAEKNIGLLARAYELYRSMQSDPWPLVCCGTGPQESLLNGKPGIQLRGFVQPDRLPAEFARAGCLVLPSSFEPWALVIHEAASAGLLILASEHVGAAVHLVQAGLNGFICGGKDARELAALMARISVMSDTELDAGSQASFNLSQQFSPKRWADTILGSPAAARIKVP